MRIEATLAVFVNATLRSDLLGAMRTARYDALICGAAACYGSERCATFMAGNIFDDNQQRPDFPGPAEMIW